MSALAARRPELSGTAVEPRPAKTSAMHPEERTPEPTVGLPNAAGRSDATGMPDDNGLTDAAVDKALCAVRAAQPEWARRGISDRLKVLRRFRLELARDPVVAASTVHRNSIAQTLSSEVLPLADACRFLECQAPGILREQRVGRSGRPTWLWGSQIRIRREPFGVVLVVGPSNYPLMLPGIHAIQALAAGNGVLLKPGRYGREAADLIAGILSRCGLPEGLLQVLSESTAAVTVAVQRGVDKIVLTGSATTGRLVAAQAAKTVTPAVMELSGCDAVFVLDDADPQLVSDCLLFGLTLNDSQTCIAPRRMFAGDRMADQVLELLTKKLEQRRRSASDTSDDAAESVPEPVRRQAAALIRRAVAAGAILKTKVWNDTGDDPMLSGVAIIDHVQVDMELAQSDLFAPVLSCLRVPDVSRALELHKRCPYALGASVFGSADKCRRLASRIHAGCVVINDMIAPTADPRLPFSGRGQSGYGVTRGAAGLQEMTQLKAVVTPRSRFRPHLAEPTPADAEVLEQLIRMEHSSGPAGKLAALPRLLAAVLSQRRFHQSEKGDTHEN